MERSEIVIKFILYKDAGEVEKMDAQVQWNSTEAKSDSEKEAEICFCMEQLFSEYTGVSLVKLLKEDQEIKKLIKP